MKSNLCLFFFLCVHLGSCVSDNERRLEETLVFAGENRTELEKVLLHYQDDSLKLEVARFLLTHMKDRHSYRGAGIDSVRQALIETSRQQGFMERGRRDKWCSYSYAGSPKVYDAQVIKADYLIENIDLAFEAWQQRGWDKYCPFDDFCNYLLPAGYGIYANQKVDTMSDLMLANVEALAQGGESQTTRYQTMGICSMWGGITYKCTTKYTAERCRLDCAK